MANNSPIGTLTDIEIVSSAEKGELIIAGFRRDHVRQACYELSLSATYYDLASPDRPVKIAPGDKLLLKPKQILVSIVEEELDLPPDVLGRVLSKGQLFSLGVVPVNTYADPGFCGRMGIVLINASNDYLAIPVGTAIAKIEFVRLHAGVEKPYQGQHGYQTAIWPIRHEYKLTEEEIRADGRIGDVPTELSRAYGDDFGRIVQRVFHFERRLLVGSAVYLTLLVGVISLAFSREERLSVATAVILGIVSNLGFLVLTWAATNLGRGRRWFARK